MILNANQEYQINLITLITKSTNSSPCSNGRRRTLLLFLVFLQCRVHHQQSWSSSVCVHLAKCSGIRRRIQLVSIGYGSVDCDGCGGSGLKMIKNDQIGTVISRPRSLCLSLPFCALSADLLYALRRYLCMIGLHVKNDLRT